MGVLEHVFEPADGRFVRAATCTDCNTWFFVEVDRSRSRVDVIVDGPTCGYCGSPPETPRTRRELRRPRHQGRDESRPPDSVRWTSGDHAPPRSPGQPTRPAPPQPSDRLGRPVRPSRRITVQASREDSRRVDVEPPTWNVTVTVAAPTQPDAPLAANRAQLDRLEHAIKADVVPQTFDASPEDSAALGSRCDNLAAVAAGLDWLGHALERFVATPIRVAFTAIGLPEPIAGMAARLAARHVLAPVLGPMRGLANGLRLTGLSLCFSNGRPLRECRCAHGILGSLAHHADHEAIAHVRDSAIDYLRHDYVHVIQNDKGPPLLFLRNAAEEGLLPTQEPEGPLSDAMTTDADQSVSEPGPPRTLPKSLKLTRTTGSTAGQNDGPCTTPAAGVDEPQIANSTALELPDPSDGLSL